MVQEQTRRTHSYEDLEKLMSLMTGDEKHSEAATSTLDVIWTLYDKIMTVDAIDSTAPDRDRFYLSKGHGQWPITQSSPPRES